MDSTPDTVVSNTTPMAGFALALAAADMNGDGVADGLVPRIGNCSVPGEGPPGEVSVYDFSTPLQSRAFVHGKNRTIALAKDASPVCIRFEPVGGSYDNADVDMSTLRLLSDDNEGISAMTPDAAKRMIVGDTDGNGIAELPTWFARSDLGSLFGSISGRGAVNARLEGQLNSHRRFLAPISLTIIGKPNTEHDAAASVFPNPLNPLGTLKFTTTKTGSVSVRVFDVGGRLVRALLASQPLAAGEHTVLFDGKDTQGTPLATGIYFYSIETSEGERRGRFVIAK